jgi:hypothetical protein
VLSLSHLLVPLLFTGFVCAQAGVDGPFGRLPVGDIAVGHGAALDDVDGTLTAIGLTLHSQFVLFGGQCLGNLRGTSGISSTLQ